MRIVKYHITIIFATIILLCFLTGLKAQDAEITFDKLTIEAGLSQSSVFSIAQDSQGFMWFGTKNGLNRYDGQQFEVFKNQPLIANSLSSSQNINALLNDSKGNLWIGTQYGLNKYNLATQVFTRYFNNPKNKNSLSNNTIRAIYEDKSGNIWVGTENGLNLWQGSQKFDRFFCAGSKANGIVSPLIKALYQDHKKNLWVGTQAGLAVISIKNNRYKFKTYHHDDSNPKSITASDVNTIIEDLNHNIWVGTHSNGLDLFDKTNQLFKHYKAKSSANSLISNIIRKIIVDKEGLLWISTFNGISVFDPVKQTFKNLTYNPDNPTSLNQNSIYDLYQDKNGSIWVGTFYGGINVYHPNVINFNVYKHYSYKNSLSSNVISALLEDKKGNIWIGTEAEGLNYLNKKTGVITNFKNTAYSNSISANLVKALALDFDNNLWIAAYEEGLDYYNAGTGEFKNFKIDNTLNTKKTTFLINDYKNQLWVGTKGGGLFLRKPSLKKFESLLIKKSPYYLPSKSINYIYQDDTKTIWVAAEDGLFFLTDGTIKFQKLTSKNDLFFNSINSIIRQSDNIIWFGSLTEGVGKYDIANKKLLLYNKKQGLPSNNVSSIMLDNDNLLWVSTDKGLAKIINQNIVIYNKSDGLPGNVFNSHSSLKDVNGNLYFGGYNGLVSFNPANIIENKVEPLVVFTHLNLFSKKAAKNNNTLGLKNSIYGLNKIELSYQDNIFSITFSALNFVKSKKNRYAYKLEGLDKDWHYIDNPVINFSNLPDDNYKLLVKAANNDGLWSSQPSAIYIKIKPPFWKTWWAYLLYFSLLAGALYFVVRFIFIRALLKREHEENQLKLDFFTNVSHEIRTPLTLILGPLEKLVQETQTNITINKQLLIVDKNAKRLMKLVNELMDFRKIESGKMKLNIAETDIIAFTKEIFLSFQHIATQKNIEYVFETHLEVLKAYIDTEQLEKIIFNLLINAIKFATQKNGVVSVNITKTEDDILILVNDNGQGIPDEAKQKLFTTFYQVPNLQQQQRNTGTGIGLALSRSIARLHQGDLYLENKSQSTSFCLKLKSGHSHFNSNEINNFLAVEDATMYKLQSEVDALIYDNTQLKNTSLISNIPLILIVEDNDEVRNFLVSSLKKSFQTITACNGSEALQIAFNKIPDVIVSDVMMPVMDGFELCNALKTDIRTRHIPIILLTARTGDLYELEGLKTGADVYLTKPFSLQKLQFTVQN
ncbi:MAG: response regulator, partial [Oligoflexus sp.]|nr:response regulator [Pseudopedobacter sp.]